MIKGGEHILLSALFYLSIIIPISSAIFRKLKSFFAQFNAIMFFQTKYSIFERDPTPFHFCE